MTCSGRDSAPLLVLVGGIMPHQWGKKMSQILVSVRGMVAHFWFQWKELCLLVGACVQNSAPRTG